MIENFIINKKTFIIAEAGVNHNGSIVLAKKLIDKAVDAGVDAIKFQTFKSENLVTKNARKADYQKKNTGSESQYNMLKKLELSHEDFLELYAYCNKKEILFLSTPFDFESVDLLEKINVPLYKISSGDLTNTPLLRYIAKLNKEIILSTGMASLGEIETAINEINKCSNNKIILLHCTSNYPTDYIDINLNAMITLKNAFNVTVGYSDHSMGIEVPIAAVAMGASVIEKHFTLDKNMEGPDHKASLDPIELKSMVKSIRNIENSLGSGIKKCNINEESTKAVARKSIVAAKDIKIGEVISYDNIVFKRPGEGLSPIYIDEVVGKICKESIEKDEYITFYNISR